MVCGKCQKLPKTTLATPDVKKKSEMYYGSPAGTSSKASGSKPSTLGQSGVVKNDCKLPRGEIAEMSANGELTCGPVCVMCGKPNKKTKSNAAPTVSGQKFTMK
ncbi:hypothetical protein UVI_02025000 [Ustilaginoidea virens]|uniref:Cysteine-rich PDZ-binding protein n=1 Tax=Ustilaginoidea virens TaxID=1159556 RepID=A0A1B5KR11_USTVR|nr:hypothetical protein UVI_02025000 [Ustilaginoidea virens]